MTHSFAKVDGSLFTIGELVHDYKEANFLYWKPRAADMALMGDGLSRFAYAVTLSRRNRQVSGQNLRLSAVVIASGLRMLRV